MRRWLPATADGRRVETGSVQFGDDWPGVFIRGDDCAYHALALSEALPRIQGADLDFAQSLMLMGPLESLAKLLVSSRLRPAPSEGTQPGGET